MSDHEFRIVGSTEAPFEVLRLSRVDESTMDMTLSVCRLGNYLTCGKTSTVLIRIQDDSDIRTLSAHLNHLKQNKFNGICEITFNEDQVFTMDQSLWHPIADALFAFSLSVDCAKLGV